MFKKCLVILLSFLISQVYATPNITRSQDIKVHKVMLVVAMAEEAEPLINELHLKPTKHQFHGLPMRGYSGKDGQIDIFLMTNGLDVITHAQNVGTQAATLSTYLGIDYFHPDLVISIGTAGGGVINQQDQAGDIYISRKIYFDARRIPMEPYRSYGLGSYTSASFSRISKKLGLQSGIICSHDSFTLNPYDMVALRQLSCDAYEMEAAAVAWVSQLMHTPMLAIKGITDNHKSKQTASVQFEQNLHAVSTKLAQVMKQFLNELSADQKAQSS